jgi:hypothetical protein
VSRGVGNVRRTPSGTWRATLSRTFPTKLAAQRALADADAAWRTPGAPASAADIARILVSLAGAGADVGVALSAALSEAAVALGSADALAGRPVAWEAAHIEALATLAGRTRLGADAPAGTPAPQGSAFPDAPTPTAPATTPAGPAHAHVAAVAAIRAEADARDARWRNAPEDDRAGYLVHQAFLDGLDTAADVVGRLG